MYTLNAWRAMTVQKQRFSMEIFPAMHVAYVYAKISQFLSLYFDLPKMPKKLINYVSTVSFGKTLSQI